MAFMVRGGSLTPRVLVIKKQDTRLARAASPRLEPEASLQPEPIYTPVPPVQPNSAEVVLTFLESVGKRADAEFYLKLFRDLPRSEFAVIAVETSVVRHALGSLVEQLRFLTELGLYAPIVLGLFDPEQSREGAKLLTEALASAGVSVELSSTNHRFATQQLRDTLERAALPVVSVDIESGSTAESRFSALASLTTDLGSAKLVVLRRHGGLVPQQASAHRSAEGISLVNLMREETSLMPTLGSDDQRILGLTAKLLRAQESSRFVVSLASPLNLLQELFTVRGAGTLIRRGSTIERHESYDTLDCERLRALLETSFSKTLGPELFARPPESIYLEENYRAVAILESSSVAPFLTKFAVSRVARGEGMARDLWDEMTQEYPSVYWRARPGNPVQNWYLKLCDGMLRRDDWHVYWTCIDAHAIGTVVDAAVARPADFSVPDDS